jgi:hypothetical protein
MEAADVGHDAGSPQTSCWKIDIEAPIRCIRRVAENVQIRLLDNVVHAQALWRGQTRGSALREGDGKNGKHNASTPAITFNRLVLRPT